MIPPNLTHAEVGAFLSAVGEQMIERDLCAEAVLDGHSDQAMTDDLWVHYGVAEERIPELLQLTLQEAIEFVRLP